MFWDSRVERAEGGALVTPAGDQLTPEMEAVLKFGLVAAQALFPVTSREEMRGLPGDNEIADVSDGDFQGIWAALMERSGPSRSRRSTLAIARGNASSRVTTAP
jgi:cytochrome c peroxidase